MPRIIKSLNTIEKKEKTTDTNTSIINNVNNVNNVNNPNKEKAFAVLQYHGKYENDEDKIDYQEMKRTILDSINDFCNEQLYGERYDISLGRPYYDIKKITLYIDMSYYDRIKNIYLDVSGSRIAFNKKSYNIYVFEPLQPLPCRNCIKSNYNVIIDMNETKNMFVNKIILSMEFVNNNDLTTNMRKYVDPKVVYEVDNGMARFVQM